MKRTACPPPPPPSHSFFLEKGQKDDARERRGGAVLALIKKRPCKDAAGPRIFTAKKKLGQKRVAVLPPYGKKKSRGCRCAVAPSGVAVTRRSSAWTWLDGAGQSAAVSRINPALLVPMSTGRPSLPEAAFCVGSVPKVRWNSNGEPWIGRISISQGHQQTRWTSLTEFHCAWCRTNKFWAKICFLTALEISFEIKPSNNTPLINSVWVQSASSFCLCRLSIFK